jgi:hypothetical protein
LENDLNVASFLPQEGTAALGSMFKAITEISFLCIES